MSVQYHDDAVLLEETITRYLGRKLDPEATERFEAHYLTCRDCYEQMRATEMLMHGLGQPYIERTQTDGITVIRFHGATQFTGTSSVLEDLTRVIKGQSDTRVLIDLSRVSRIDSSGLGILMNCYAHAVRNAGILKLLHPSKAVKQVLSMTRIDSVVPTFEDENAALQSFRD